jgi:hypothetical protein
MKGMESINGIWVVSTHNHSNIILSNFDHVLGKPRPDKVNTIQLPGTSAKHLVGDDGVKLDFTLGALFLIEYRPQPGNELGMYMVNVGTDDPTTMIQYEYVLAKLGIGTMPRIDDDRVLAAEGQFRKLLTDLASGAKNN